jgi:integrase/recombinase XerD
MKSDESFSCLLNLYLAWLKVSNFADTSVRNSGYDIRFFMKWCETRGISEPREVTYQILLNYQRWLYIYRKKDGKPLKTTTQLKRLVLVRNFFKWLSKKNHIVFNPAADLDLPRKNHELPRAVLSHEDVESVINQPDIDSPFGLRDRTILEILYSTGIRRKELYELKIYDIERAEGVILIRKGKGGKDRRIPIGARALKWIEKYLKEVRPSLVQGKDDQDLLLTYTGKPLSTNGLGKLVHKYIEAAGIKKRGSCHMFRHSMATQMLEGGADIRFIQEMLGHKKLDSTQIYTKVSIGKLKEVHTKTHPARLDGLKLRTEEDVTTS